MVRTKVQHKLISDEKARKTTFTKRKNGLLKKLEEITTLCGVATCAFIIHNFRGKGKKEGKKDEVEVWPSEPKASSMLKKYKELPQRKQEKYMLNHEALSKERLEKMKKALKNQREKNQLLEIDLLLKEDCPTTSEDCPTTSGEDLDFGAKEELNYKREIVKNFKKKVTELIEDLESGYKNK
ncbi:Agamous-like MADS-box protein AGL90 [Linum perenne]